MGTQEAPPRTPNEPRLVVLGVPRSTLDRDSVDCAGISSSLIYFHLRSGLQAARTMNFSPLHATITTSRKSLSSATH